MTVQALSVLAGCAAVACCPQGASARSLEHFAAATGFGVFVHYHDLADLRAHPVKNLFFLVHFALPDSEMADFLALLRQNTSNRVRLAPVVLVTQDCDLDTFLGYVQMGFDDILCLPDNASLLVDRLVAQLNHDILYFETEDYFGPDRRRMELPGATHAARVSSAHRHTRLVVHRSLEQGPMILHRQDHWDRAVH
jgi:DNA-binding response OmpR family regulator